jgi:hypothetical protein
MRACTRSAGLDSLKSPAPTPSRQPSARGPGAPCRPFLGSSPNELVSSRWWKFLGGRWGRAPVFDCAGAHCLSTARPRPRGTIAVRRDSRSRGAVRPFLGLSPPDPGRANE